MGQRKVAVVGRPRGRVLAFAAVPCVTEAQVLGFMADTLAAEERSVIEAHLDSCDECLELVTLVGKSSLAVRGERASAEEPEVVPGTWIGRYEIEEPLGRGGMGVVYTARDSQLGRRVALKLVTPELAGQAQSQLALLREAQAMARITQPNVLTVYDSGTFGDAVFLVAERVDGETLEAWLATPRPWRAIVDVFLQAARGLDAAHGAGLVHRDFKPSNVLVGSDGRARVFDFGVVWFADAGASRRELAGTPLYMSPEQRRGEVADARSDQYAFCLALRDALFGELPGAPTTSSGASDRVPAWMRELTARGIEREPDRRFPTMRVLIDTLEARLRRGRRRRIALVGGAAVAVAASAVLIAYVRGANAQLAECAEPTVEAWSSGVRARIAAKLGATGLPYAAASWASAERGLDDYVRRWRAHGRAGCLAAPADPALHARRSSCLERDRIAFEATVAYLEGADRSVVERLPKLVGSLPDLDACTQSEARAWPPDRARLVEHYREAARIGSLADAGRFDEAARALAPVVARSSTLGFPEAEAEVAYLGGRIASMRGEYAEAWRLLESARWKADTVRSDELVVNVTTELLYLVGTLQRRSSETRELINHATSAAERVGSTAARLRAARAIGAAEAAAGNYSAAETQLQHARQLVMGATPVDRAQLAGVLADLGSLASRERRYPEAEQLRRQAAELTAAELGTEHPLYGQLLSNLASSLASLDRLSEARELFARAVALRERSLGAEHPELAVTLDAFGHVLLRTGELPRARTVFERALAIVEKHLPPTHAMQTTVRHSIAKTLDAQHERAAAERLYRRVYERQRAELGAAHHATIETVLQLSILALRRRDHADARAICEGLLADDAIKDRWTRATATTCIGEAELVADQREAALKTLTRALPMYPPGHDPFNHAWTQFLIATALPASERARALELARTARARIGAHPALFEPELERIDAWLAKMN